MGSNRFSTHEVENQPSPLAPYDIQCLDVLRAMRREPSARDASLAELAAARGGHPAFDAALAQLARDLDDQDQLEQRSRAWVERVALLLQASLLLRAAPNAIADLFCASRLGGAHGLAFGTLPAGVPYETILERAFKS